VVSTRSRITGPRTIPVMRYAMTVGCPVLDATTANKNATTKIIAKSMGINEADKLTHYNGLNCFIKSVDI
jgi:hypothetical protein